MLQNLEVNKKVLDADIHQLFLYYNMAFFNGTLDAVMLEWSKKMTLCAGICYYEVSLLIYPRGSLSIKFWVGDSNKLTLYRMGLVLSDLARIC